MNISIYVDKREKELWPIIALHMQAIGFEHYISTAPKPSKLQQFWSSVKRLFKTQKADGEYFFFISNKNTTIRSYIG